MSHTYIRYPRSLVFLRRAKSPTMHVFCAITVFVQTVTCWTKLMYHTVGYNVFDATDVELFCVDYDVMHMYLFCADYNVFDATDVDLFCVDYDVMYMYLFCADYDVFDETDVPHRWLPL